MSDIFIKKTKDEGREESLNIGVIAKREVAGGEGEEEEGSSRRLQGGGRRRELPTYSHSQHQHLRSSLKLKNTNLYTLLFILF